MKIVVPFLGDSVAKAKLTELCVSQGDFVNEDEVIAVLESDKVSFEVCSEQDGRVSNIAVKVGDMLSNGDVICELQELSREAGEQKDAINNAVVKKVAAPQEEVVSSLVNKDSCDSSDIIDRLLGAKLPSEANGHESARSLMGTAAEKAKECHCGSSCECRQLDGSCPCNNKAEKAKECHCGSSCECRQLNGSCLNKGISDLTKVSPLSGFQKAVINNLTAAHSEKVSVTTFNEIDMTNLLALRSRLNDKLTNSQERKIGITAFFVKALTCACTHNMHILDTIDQGNLIEQSQVNIGVAMDVGSGLFVPVINRCEDLSVHKISDFIHDLSNKIKGAKILPQDLQGANITISNGGTFGSLLSTPALSSGGSAILGLHKIKKTPYVINNEICIRDIMQVALSYDHRVIDGRQAIGFLNYIKHFIESPELSLLSV